MPGKRSRRSALQPSAPVSLRFLADHLNLSPATVSLVVNKAPGAAAIPARTQERVLQAARKFNYRANFTARSLRKQRTFTVGVLVPEVSEGYAAMVMSGIEDWLLQEGYFYFVASHRHRVDLIEEYPRIFVERGVEALIAVDTPGLRRPSIPVVAVSGREHLPGVTNVVLDHDRAAELALQHLAELGHRHVAFIKGQEFSSDTSIRWNAIRSAAAKVGMPIDAKLVVQLEGDSPSPELGYEVAQKLLRANRPFTSIFCFNDISAIGAMRALREKGIQIPEEVSVIGFDDIQSAAFQNPPLTTVRQPLRRMGELAARTALRRVTEPRADGTPEVIVVEPDLIVRGSTGRSPAVPGKLSRGSSR